MYIANEDEIISGAARDQAISITSFLKSELNEASSNEKEIMVDQHIMAPGHSAEAVREALATREKARMALIVKTI